MNTENLDMIGKLNRCAKALAGFWGTWNTTYMADSNCDKKGAAFNGDSRFTVFKIQTDFSAYKGFYGNSGASTFSNGIDADLAQKYFSQALNMNKEKIFNDMAVIMKAEAAKLTEQAEKEVDALNKLIADVKSAA